MDHRHASARSDLPRADHAAGTDTAGTDTAGTDEAHGAQVEPEQPDAGAGANHAHHGAGHAGHAEHAGHRGHASHAEHGQHAGHGDHAAVFRERFWLSLLLSIPVVYFSEMVGDLLGYTPISFPGSRWIGPVLGTFIYFWGGWPFLTGATSELRRRKPGMMTLVATAITVAFVASLLTSLNLAGLTLDFWWELVLLIVIMLLGHWLEMRALGQSSRALEALSALLPDDAERLDPTGATEIIATSELRPDDLVLVRPGGRVPADGEVVDGHAEVDESMITGESRPVPKDPGDRVVAGTVATDSSLRVRVNAVGDQTTLAGIRRLVEQAQSSRSRAQALADRAAALLFYIAIAAAAITFVVWLSLDSLGTAVTRTVTVLVISCPHALGLAIPLVIAISTGRAASNGVLVKDRLALERMRLVDVVLFDKTGTLTEGRHRVTDVQAAGATGEDSHDDPGTDPHNDPRNDKADGRIDEVLRLAAAAEGDSEHPLARAIVAAAKERGLDIPNAENFRSMTGRGVRAEVEGHEVAVGGPALLRERGLTEDAALSRQTSRWRERGASILHVLRDDQVIGAIELEDAVRPESREAIDALHRRGIKAAMITGDSQEVADAVAADLDIDQVFAQVLPENKEAKVAELQQRGNRVAMVGDGVNDAPALARADAGLAIGAGTDVAIESAGIVLASDDPRGTLFVRDLSKAAYVKMLQNLGWAVGYNVVMIPLAAGALAPWGIVPPPEVGAILMSLSTIVVALNAQLLRRAQLGI